MKATTLPTSLALALGLTLTTSVLAKAPRPIRRHPHLIVAVFGGTAEHTAGDAAENGDKRWGLRLRRRPDGEELELRGQMRLGLRILAIDDIELSVEEKEVSLGTTDGEYSTTRTVLCVTAIQGSIYKKDEQGEKSLVGSFDLTVDPMEQGDNNVPRVNGTATVQDDEYLLSNGKIRFARRRYRHSFLDTTADDDSQLDATQSEATVVDDDENPAAQETLTQDSTAELVDDAVETAVADF